MEERLAQILRYSPIIQNISAGSFEVVFPDVKILGIAKIQAPKGSMTY